MDNLKRIILVTVLFRAGYCQNLNAEHWIAQLNMTSLLPGQPYFSHVTPLESSTFETTSRNQGEVTRHTSSNDYVLFTSYNNLVSMYTLPVYEVLHHVRGWPVDVHIIDPVTEIMTNHTLGPREKDTFTVVLPPDHFIAWRFKPRRDVAYSLTSLTTVPEFRFKDGKTHNREFMLKRFPQYSRILRRLTYPDDDRQL